MKHSASKLKDKDYSRSLFLFIIFLRDSTLKLPTNKSDDKRGVRSQKNIKICLEILKLLYIIKTWQTGRIGVNALSGTGFFQGKITEEILKNKGFEKREV